MFKCILFEKTMNLVIIWILKLSPLWKGRF